MANEFKVKNGLLVSGSANIASSGSYIFSVDGNSGRLLQVDDGLQSGSIYSVNTISGLPIIDAFANSTVRISKYGKIGLFVSQSKVGIGKEYPLNGVLDVSGSTTITGSLDVSSTFTSSLQQGYFWIGNSINKTTTIPTASFATTGSNVFRGNQTITGSVNISGSQTITGSLIVSGTYGGLIQISELSPTDQYIYTISSASIDAFKIDRGLYTSINGNVDITGSLIVAAPDINIIVGQSDVNNYSQINITNANAGSGASSDIVATNDTGTETGNFVDLGINSSTFNGLIGVANDAYLYTTGSNFYIGNTTRGNKSVKFFSGNDATIIPLEVSGSVITAPNIYGNTAITGSLTVTGTVTALGTPSLFTANGETITSTTLVNIQGMTDPVTAGTYIVDAWLYGQSSTNAGAQFAISGSGTVTSIGVTQSGTGTATALRATGYVTTNDAVSTVFWDTATTEGWVHLTGQIVLSTAGNITIRALKVTSGNLIIRSNTYMTVTKVA